MSWLEAVLYFSLGACLGYCFSWISWRRNVLAMRKDIHRLKDENFRIQYPKQVADDDEWERTHRTYLGGLVEMKRRNV